MVQGVGFEPPVRWRCHPHNPLFSPFKEYAWLLNEGTGGKTNFKRKLLSAPNVAVRIIQERDNNGHWLSDPKTAVTNLA
jgi:hypothetical protein